MGMKVCRGGRGDSGKFIQAQSLSKGTSAQPSALTQLLPEGKTRLSPLTLLADRLLSMGFIGEKGLLVPAGKRDQKQRRNLNPLGSYLVTQEDCCCSLQRTPKREFPRARSIRATDVTTRKQPQNQWGSLPALESSMEDSEQPPPIMKLDTCIFYL